MTDLMLWLNFVSTLYNFQNFDPNNFCLNSIVECYGGAGRIIVFTSTKADANSLLLSDKIKHDIEAMHGDIA